MNFGGVDLDSRGSYVVGDGDGKLISCGALEIPQKPRSRESDTQFRTRRIFALAGTIKRMKHLGCRTIFVEESDWHRPIYEGIGRAMKMKDITAAVITDKQNRTVARALGRLEGVFLSLCLMRRMRYMPIPVHAAKFAATRISGKKTVTKKSVQEIVLRYYPQVASITSDDFRETVCDSVSVWWAGMLQNDPLFYMKLGGWK